MMGEKLKWGLIANGAIANAFANSIKNSKTSSSNRYLDAINLK